MIRKFQADFSRIANGYGIEDNIIFGSERDKKEEFGRAAFFGRQDEANERHAFFRIQKDELSSAEEIEKYYELHPFIKDPPLIVPSSYKNVNGSISNPNPRYLLSPDAIQPTPFEARQQATKHNSNRYIRNLKMYNKFQRAKQIPSSPNLLSTEEMEEVEKLLSLLSLKREEANQASITKMKVSDISGTVLGTNRKKLSLEPQKLPLTSGRQIGLEDIHSVDYRSRRRYLRYDKRRDIHQIDFSYEGELRQEKDDVFDVDAFNERLRRRRLLDALSSSSAPSGSPSAAPSMTMVEKTAIATATSSPLTSSCKNDDDDDYI